MLLIYAFDVEYYLKRDVELVWVVYGDDPLVCRLVLVVEVELDREHEHRDSTVHYSRTRGTR